VNFEYDEAKSRSNFEKHGLRLEWAAFADWANALTIPDERKDYGEIRINAYVPYGTEARLHVVCYTDRGDTRRFISFRKANKGEIEDYDEAAHR
jgi:uncharacterized DUF497 family protein